MSNEENPLERAPHRSDWSPATFIAMVNELLRNGLRIESFPATDSQIENALYIRHDVEVSLNDALTLAEIESKNRIVATYFLAIDSPLINVATPEFAATAETLRRLGHSVGAHLNLRPETNAADVKRLLLIASAASESIDTTLVSLHAPGAVTTQTNAAIISATRRVHDMLRASSVTYVSDSGGDWSRDPIATLRDRSDCSMQLLIHPVWWARPATPNRMSIERVIATHTADVGGRLRSYMPKIGAALSPLESSTHATTTSREPLKAIVPSIGIGTMNFGAPTPPDDCLRIVTVALESGATLINVSDSDYSGRALEIISPLTQDNVVRSRMTLAVEFVSPAMGLPFDPDLSAKQIEYCCERALRILKTDHIDLAIIPRPSARTPIEETLESLTQLHRSGKIGGIATSGFAAWQVVSATVVAKTRGWLSPQFEFAPFNLMDRRAENELLPMATKHGIGIIAWAPLAQGVLSGRYAPNKDLPADSRAARLGGIYLERVSSDGVRMGNRFSEMARGFGRTPSELALAWVVAQPGVACAVFGPRLVKHMDLIAAVRARPLTTEEERACSTLNPPGSALANFHNTIGWMRMRLRTAGEIS